MLILESLQEKKMSSDSLQRKQNEHDQFLLVAWHELNPTILAQLVKIAMHPIPDIEKQKTCTLIIAI